MLNITEVNQRLLLHRGHTYLRKKLEAAEIRVRLAKTGGKL